MWAARAVGRGLQRAGSGGCGACEQEAWTAVGDHSARRRPDVFAGRSVDGGASQDSAAVRDAQQPRLSPRGDARATHGGRATIAASRARTSGRQSRIRISTTPKSRRGWAYSARGRSAIPRSWGRRFGARSRWSSAASPRWWTWLPNRGRKRGRESETDEEYDDITIWSRWTRCAFDSCRCLLSLPSLVPRTPRRRKRRAEDGFHSGRKCQEWRETFRQLWLLCVPRTTCRRFVGYGAAPWTERGDAGLLQKYIRQPTGADASLHHEGRLGRGSRGYFRFPAVATAAAQGGYHSGTQVREYSLHGALFVCLQESRSLGCAPFEVQGERDDRRLRFGHSSGIVSEAQERFLAALGMTANG